MFQAIGRKATEFVTDNAPALLTGVGVVGTVSTAVLSGRASIKAYQLVDEERKIRVESEGPVTQTDMVKMTWPLFVPPVVTGGATVAAIIFAHRISAQQVAAMAALYGLSEGRFQEYKDKVAETIGVNKEKRVHDELAQDRVSKTENKEVIILGDGEVLCFDQFTGRYFRSTMDRIKKAENSVNREIYNYDYASLSHFYEEIGLPPTSYSDEVGWNTDNPLEIKYSTTLNEDEKPCIAIDFKYSPGRDYNSGRHHSQ